MDNNESPDTPRLIKKYPNRRLYDTSESRYITLADVERLVHAQTEFRIEDARTHEDLTSNILLQIISEREDSGQPIFTQNVLKKLVRMYGGGFEELAQSHFERSLALWAETQELMREHLAKPPPSDPMTAIQEITERNLNLWRDMQTSFIKAYQPPRATKKTGKSGKKKDKK